MLGVGSGRVAAYLASFPSRPQSDRTILTIRRLPSKTPHACNSVSILRLDRLEKVKRVGLALVAASAAEAAGLAAMMMMMMRVYV